MQTSCTQLYTPYHTHKILQVQIIYRPAYTMYHISTLYRHNSFLGKSVYHSIPANSSCPFSSRPRPIEKTCNLNKTSFQNAGNDFTVSASWPCTIHNNKDQNDQRNGAYIMIIYAYCWSKPSTLTAPLLPNETRLAGKAAQVAVCDTRFSCDGSTSLVKVMPFHISQWHNTYYIYTTSYYNLYIYAYVYLYVYI